MVDIEETIYAMFGLVAIVLIGVAGHGYVNNQEIEKICESKGYVFVDRQCLDVKVIEL